MPAGMPSSPAEEPTSGLKFALWMIPSVTNSLSASREIE
jgi:hypothetical protein